MKFKLLFVIGLCFVLVGCESPKASMNLQRSAARDVGDTSVTVYLDKRDAHDVDEKQKRILEIANEIEKLLDSGEIGSMTAAAFKKQINKIVPDDFSDLSDAILNYLSGLKVPTDKVPVNIVRNIKALLKGVRLGISEYKLEDRLPEE